MCGRREHISFSSRATGKAAASYNRYTEGVQMGCTSTKYFTHESPGGFSDRKPPMPVCRAWFIVLHQIRVQLTSLTMLSVHCTLLFVRNFGNNIGNIYHVTMCSTIGRETHQVGHHFNCHVVLDGRSSSDEMGRKYFATSTQAIL